MTIKDKSDVNKKILRKEVMKNFNEQTIATQTLLKLLRD